MTELYDLLRLCWARLGSAPGGADGPRLERRLFSFNSPHGACPACKGLGVEDRLDPDLLISDPSKTVRGGALRITTPTGYLIYSQVTIDVLDQVCRAHGFSVDLPWQALTPDQRDVILNGSDRIRIPYGKHPLESRMRWTGITARPREEGVYKGILPVMEQILRQKRNANILRFVRSLPCRACQGTRLRPEALAVTFGGMNIAEAAALTIADLRRFFQGRAGGPGPARIGRQVDERCDTLQRLGLGYLTLDRESTTLSAGEAQRVRLAALAGIGLQGVLFVLDEPSVGLHHHDTGLLLDVIRGLRDRGNTVLVVEHDDQTILQADWIIDVGPGAGTAGGELLYSGPARAFVGAAQPGAAHRLADSRTRAFLTGAERIALPARRREGSGSLVVEGVTRHNLQGVRAEFRMGALNVVTGVSGAGKSTLVEETRRLLRGDGPAGPALPPRVGPDRQDHRDRPGANRPDAALEPRDLHRACSTACAICSPPNRRRSAWASARAASRSTSAAAAARPARARESGRSACSSSGRWRSTCESCDGRRFNDATLAVQYRGATIHDVLEMPIADALALFADQPPIARTLGTLDALGLGYLRVGHPATMLSGGEAQRVKLASELARPGTGRTLYILDEPTTGLHPADIVLLLAAVDGLVERGNTAIVIEHHLDVIKAADRVIDLGPGSGSRGGAVVAAGTPEEVAAAEGSLTGAALRGVLSADGTPVSQHASVEGADAVSRRWRTNAAAPIRFTGVSTHNLQHIDVEIPRHRMTVITGVSGSGKSSLAFDTIFAEGRRRFAGSFSTYARRFVPQDGDARFDGVSGLTPTVAIRQQAPSRNPRSTVATLTEIHDGYRLLYSRLGTRMCPQCGAGLDGRAVRLVRVRRRAHADGGDVLAELGAGRVPAVPRPRPHARVRPGEARDGPVEAAGGRRHGRPQGRAVLRRPPRAAHGDAARRRVGAGRGRFGAVGCAERSRARRSPSAAPVTGCSTSSGGTAAARARARTASRRRGRACSSWSASSTSASMPTGAARPSSPSWSPSRAAPAAAAAWCRRRSPCASAGVNIHELLSKTVDESLEFFGSVPDGRAAVDDREGSIGADLRLDIIGRLAGLRDAGLGYLGLDRSASTLSGGEAQRVRLAAALRSGLTGVTYVLDEPTAGLHARDTSRLLGLVSGLRDAGNTVVVVEHDLDVDRGRRPRDRDRSRRGAARRARRRCGHARGRGVMRRIENGPPSPDDAGGPPSRPRGGRSGPVSACAARPPTTCAASTWTCPPAASWR